MRTLRVVLALVLLTVATAATAQRGARGPQWTVLGSRVVTDRADHDTIVVGGTRGTFDAIKFEVRGHGVDFQRVVIHFANGDDQKVELRDSIRAGGESRAIDIDGTNRVIRSIDFWYDAKTFGRGGKATVRTFGRH